MGEESAGTTAKGSFKEAFDRDQQTKLRQYQDGLSK